MKAKVLLGFVFSFILPSYSVFACTVFYAANDTIALAGSNKDWISAESYVWFCPPEKNKYGRIYLGFDLFLDQKEPSGGINDQGLFFEMVYASDLEFKNDITGESYRGNILEKILEECSSVEEVLDLLKKYNNLQYYANHYIMFGDKQGNSVIIKLGQIFEYNSQFQILPFKDESPCDQYLITYNTLNNNSSNLSVGLFKKILSNVHVEGTMGYGTTVYSTIYDLKNGQIHLYYFHNFMEEVIFNIEDELKKGFRTLKIVSLFPKNIAAEDYIDQKNMELKQRIESRWAKNISIEDFVKVEGEFRSLDTFSKDRFRIMLENKKLYITVNNDSKFELYPESSSKFFIPSVSGDFSLTFLKDDPDNSLKVLVEYESKFFKGIQQTFQKIN